MSLAERLKAAQTPPKPKFHKWVESLPEDDRAALIEAAASHMPHKTLISIVREEGGSISEDRLKEWRKSHGWAG